MSRKQKSPRDPELIPNGRTDHVTTRFTKMGLAIHRLGMRFMDFETDGYGDHSLTDYDRDHVSGSGAGTKLTKTEAAAYARMTGVVTFDARKALADFVDDLDRRVDKFLDRNKWVQGGDVREAPDVWCESCVRVKLYEPRYRGQLCRSCYDYSLAHNGVWPTGAYVKAKSEGVRMTTRVVAELEAK